MKKHLLKTLFIIVLNFVICENTYAASKPSWVKQRPSETDYYIGIGMALKSDTDKNLQYTRDSRSKALSEMSSEIKVTISSNSLLRQFEKNNFFREEFESKIYTSVAQTLEGYEVVTWENKKEYWVMVRLNKDKYELRRRQKLDQAKMLASSFFLSARESAERGEVAQAISNYFKAVTALQNYLGEDLTHRSAHGTVNFSTDIMKDLRSLYRQVVLRPEKSAYMIEFSRQLQEPLKLQVTINKNGEEIPVQGLPVEFLFSRGEGSLMPQAATDFNGYVQCSVSRLISKRKLQEVTACLNLSSILKLENLDSPLLPYFFPGDDLPTARIGIELNKATAYLDLDESVFGQVNSAIPFGYSIRADLNENFFNFTDDKNLADYIVRLSLRFRKGEERQGTGYSVFLVYSDLHLSIVSARHQTEIFSDGFLEVCGMRPGSYDHALKEAREKVLSKFRDEILPKLELVDM